jgi:dihydrofolate reductase
VFEEVESFFGDDILMPNRVRLPSISFIVARSYPGNVIGYRNQLPWHLKSDLKRFREITTDHVIIMGRTTFQSIGRALPHRTNVVMSKNNLYRNENGSIIDPDTNLYFTDNLVDALFYSDVVSILRGKKDIFVIGGAMLYDLFNEHMNKVYLTQVFGEFKGDAYFSEKFPSPKWRVLTEIDFPKNHIGDDFPHRFSIHERRERRNRYEYVTNFFTEKQYKDKWLENKIKERPSIIAEYVQENLDLEI